MQSVTPSFLIVKMSSLGDIVQCFGVVDYLLSLYPHAKIDWVVEKPFEALLKAHPQVHQVIPAETKKWRSVYKNIQPVKAFCRELRAKKYDAIFDLQGNCKSGVITLLGRGIDKVGFASDVVPEWPNLLATSKTYSVDLTTPIRQQYLRLVQQYFADDSPYVYEGTSLLISPEQGEKIEEFTSFSSPLFMVCPGSNWKNKRLSEKSLVEFLSQLKKELDASFLFIFGSREEKENAFSLQSRFGERSMMMGDLDFALWQHIMSKVSCVISMDSSALHLCSTTPTPSFSVFGPSSSEVYAPAGRKHFSYQGNCPYGERFVKRCSQLRHCETGACMKDISPTSLSKAFIDWWKQVACQNRDALQPR